LHRVTTNPEYGPTSLPSFGLRGGYTFSVPIFVGASLDYGVSDSRPALLPTLMVGYDVRDAAAVPYATEAEKILAGGGGSVFLESGAVFVGVDARIFFQAERMSEPLAAFAITNGVRF
jgi:hypothetical protein